MKSDDHEIKRFVKNVAEWYYLGKPLPNTDIPNDTTSSTRKPKRPYIKVGIIRRLLENCGYRCCICHKPFFTLYHRDGDTSNHDLMNLVPVCSNHDLAIIEEIPIAKIMTRRKNMCPICNKPFISIHHIDGDPRNMKMDNLVPLCRVCHIRHDNYTSQTAIKRMKKIRDEWTAFLANRR